MPKPITVSGNGYDYIKSLKRQKATFKVVFTSASVEVELSGGQKIRFGEPWRNKALGLFSKTKSHLSKLGAPPDIKARPSYIGVMPCRYDKMLYTEVCAVDIDAAYHTAAANLGYFSPEIYQAHLESDKKSRLQAFGATAKHAEIFQYIEGRLTSCNVNQSPLRPYFLNAAAYVSGVMENIKDQLKNDFYFYWVDCLFFKDTEQNREYVEQALENSNFSYHYEPCRYVIFETHEKKYTILREKNGKIKEYNFRRQDSQLSERQKFKAELKNE